ncbi:MAG: MBOAT family protein [Bacteroidales bacterium]|nr:MBOAT family protein [Bacteroidales bacterium]
MRDIFVFLGDLFSFDQEHPLLFVQFNFWFFLLLVIAGLCLMQSRKFRLFLKNKGLMDNRFGRYLRRLPKITLRNGYLFLVSLFFYYKTSGLFILLLVFSTILGYYLGKSMNSVYKKKTDRGRKMLATVGVVVNLLVLAYFKYAYFFTDVYNNMFDSDLHVVNHLAKFANHFTSTPRFDVETILLPVGISFFTFQNISYIVDVYKRRIACVENILDFGFYTTFFPQLVAGPIVRADQFVPQLYRSFFLSRRQFGLAVFWILNGLLKKIVLSDYLSVNFVDRVFELPSMYTGFENLMALFVYSLQVYADFSGYTDIAIGVAMLMGFYLPQNFNSPYKATNAAGFWKRWHMSLSNWLKDYLYIPLGGNRKATWVSYFILVGMMLIVAAMARKVWVTTAVVVAIIALVAIYCFFPLHRREFQTNVNNMDTMLLGGLWHGASFNFITWGALNGFGILIYKWWKGKGKRIRVVTTQLLFIVFMLADLIWPAPALKLGVVWSGFIFVGTALRYFVVEPLCSSYGRVRLAKKIEQCWNILQTFVFISFTRLFFRSGSNLDPSEANYEAWQTVKAMVNQIGGVWDWSVVPQVCSLYSGVFVVFVLGMIVHWLPDNWKRRYRLWFTRMPMWLLSIIVVAVVFVAYQFTTSGLLPFIYFQF